MYRMEPNDTPEEYYIRRCLTLAERGRPTVSPNPMVGAVVLDAEGKKVAEGFHQRAGEGHAEVLALEQAGSKARGGTLFLNLEPCCHKGRTPPCTERVIDAGIRRVVCGTVDPNPLVSGKGLTRLQSEGIHVQSGFLEAECRRLNEVFFHYIRTGKPFVTLKLAMTLDGKIATRSGESKWLTGPMARQYVHHLRSWHDVILTTSETVVADNPRLIVRGGPETLLGSPPRLPRRIVLDRRERLDAARYDVFDTSEAPTTVVNARSRQSGAYGVAMQDRGVERIAVQETGLGLDLADLLTTLGEKQVSSVMVEAGGRLAGSLLSAGLVNKLVLFYAPKVLHDPHARLGISGAINLGLAEAPSFSITHTRQLGPDWVVEAYPTHQG
jgi:diaminohydroxyphosphoribosylaminopyrimidine deaminase/5-amino-6-(5-phosphoribosylamino)uracil reductase